KGETNVHTLALGLNQNPDRRSQPRGRKQLLGSPLLHGLIYTVALARAGAWAGCGCLRRRHRRRWGCRSRPYVVRRIAVRETAAGVELYRFDHTSAEVEDCAERARTV